jgi:hypothetical protein
VREAQCALTPECDASEELEHLLPYDGLRQPSLEYRGAELLSSGLTVIHGKPWRMLT